MAHHVFHKIDIFFSSFGYFQSYTCRGIESANTFWIVQKVLLLCILEARYISIFFLIISFFLSTAKTIYFIHYFYSICNTSFWIFKVIFNKWMYKFYEHFSSLIWINTADFARKIIPFFENFPKTNENFTIQWNQRKIQINLLSKNS